MARKKEDGINMQEAINSATQQGVQNGITDIIESRPRFRNTDFSKYIDSKKLNEAVKRTYNALSKEKLSEEKTVEYLREVITAYVAQGSIFNEIGQKLVLEGGLGKRDRMNPLEKALNVVTLGILPRKKPDNLENIFGAHQNIYNLFKSGDYAQRMPELAIAAETIDKMGFLDTSLDTLYAHGQMDQRKYKFLKKALSEKTEEANRDYLTNQEKYIMQPYQKAAAFILGIVGIVAILGSGKIITGGIIGTLNATGLGIAGIVLLFFSIILFFGIKKSKKPKNVLKPLVRKKHR